MENFAQVLLLQGVADSVIVTFNRFHIPSSLGYLLVGLILGPHTMGPVIDIPPKQVMRRIQEQRSGKYCLIWKFFRGDTLTGTAGYGGEDHVRSIEIPPDCKSIGRQLGEINPGGVTVIAIVRHGDRLVIPSSDKYCGKRRPSDAWLAG